MRFPELDQETIKSQTLFSDGLSVSSGTGKGDGKIDQDRDLLEIPMFGGDRFECRGDPSEPPFIELKHHIFEFFRL